jgi:hypothetical protein
MAPSDLFQYCPQLAEMMRSRTVIGRSGKTFTGLEALSTVNNLVVLRNICLNLKPQRTLEIGLSFGGSCLVFTSSHRDLGRSPEGQHVALDPHQTQGWDDCGLLVTERAGLKDYLSFRQNFSHSELPLLLDQKLDFDLVYVDGSHLFEDVFVDSYFVARLLSENGWVIFDDSSDPNVRKVLGFIRRNLGQSLVEIDLGPYRLDGGASVKYRVAKLLRRTQMTAFKRSASVVRPWNAKFREF